LNDWYGVGTPWSLCGKASIDLKPGKKYIARVSKSGFIGHTINFEIPDEYKRLDVSLSPKETD
jgi:hypothetical protein